MARKVLGNDPFRRGAAARDDLPEAPKPPPPPKPPEPAKAAKRRPDTPELQVPRGAKGPGAPRITPAPPKGSAHAAPKGPLARHEPVAHPGSPKVKGEPTDPRGLPVPSPGAPRPHGGAPSASAAPRAHAGAPSVPVDPIAHAAAPSAVPLGSAPRPHAGSPTVPFEPTAHEAAPSAVPLGSAPRPPPSAPFEATPHAGTASVARATPPAPEAPVAPLARPPASLPGAIKGLWRALRTAGGLASRGAEVDAWGKDAELTRQLRPLAELLYEKYWRVHTEGLENVPRGGCILVANHAGALPLDGPVLHLSLKRERPDLADARWLLEDQVFHAPFVGLLANRMGAVRASPENAMRLLGEGRPVIVFPEGFHGLSKRFGERYQLRRFGRGGYLKIAIRAGVPVVPVAIVGGEESMPLLAKVPGSFLGVEYLPVTLPPLPARWFIRFGAPIDFADAPATPEDDLAWIERTNVAVRDEIERMLGELLAGRDRVF